MQFQASQQITGDSITYQISEHIKQYPLIDLGFEKTRQGNYKYEGSLDRQNPFKPVAKLRIVINQDLTGFKMETVNANGLQKINIYQMPRAEEFKTQLQFIMDEMVEREIFKRG
ncbi:cysteine desulfurase [Limosilactobacillus gastricus]|uniref:cysteine desulfurase n=1 Tax=Limosilactobacillus gastricus TaxID=227942 RepID=UPI0026EEE1A4|nr:cysteine desulfurase [Limosilactobacillus gastricus]